MMTHLLSSAMSIVYPKKTKICCYFLTEKICSDPWLNHWTSKENSLPAAYRWKCPLVEAFKISNVALGHC